MKLWNLTQLESIVKLVFQMVFISLKILKLGQVHQCLGVHLTDTGTQIFAGNFVDHVNSFLFCRNFSKICRKNWAHKQATSK